MLKRIAGMRAEKAIWAVENKAEMLEEIEREWKTQGFDRQIEEVEKVKEVPAEIENKLKIIQIPSSIFESVQVCGITRLAKQFDLTEVDPAKKVLI